MIETKPITEELLHDLENKGQRYEVIHGELMDAEITGEDHGSLEFKIGDIITHIDLLPGFSLDVAAVFEA